LLVSSDKDFNSLIKTAALTLTKLNCQVSIYETGNFDIALIESQKNNLDIIIVDFDDEDFDKLKLISEIRKNEISKSKKIISVFENVALNSKDKIYASGCDSIMSKMEFKKAVNNILQF